MVLHASDFWRCCSWWKQKAKGNSWSFVAEENTPSRCWPVRIWYFLITSYLPQLSYCKFCLARIQYLPSQEKDQIQDFRNWIESSPETSTRSTPESPIIGLIENSIALSPNMDMPGMAKEPALEVPTPTPADGTSNAAGHGSDRAEGSKNPTVRLVPFQSMPQST